MTMVWHLEPVYILRIHFTVQHQTLHYFPHFHLSQSMGFSKTMGLAHYLLLRFPWKFAVMNNALLTCWCIFQWQMFERIEKIERQLEPSTQLASSIEKLGFPISNCKTESNSCFEKRSFPKAGHVILAEHSCLSKESEAAFTECRERGEIQSLWYYYLYPY